jgi:catechol 2,3-dioxygenase-like lactoylglutathione lyase family enzyme
MEALEMKAPIPVLRIFDEAKAREFYLDFLGFHLDWQHRLGDNFPAFMQISSGACIIHLSEHHGDACPGAALRIEMEALEELHKALTKKEYTYAKPGIEARSYGVREMVIADPFGNRLIFFDRQVSAATVSNSTRPELGLS